MGSLAWYWHIPGVWFIYHFFTGWRDKPQNLRDCEREIKYTWFNFRNWNNDTEHSYQFVWHKNPMSHPFAISVTFAGKLWIKFHIDFLGLRLFYRFTDRYEGREYGINYYTDSRSLVIYWAYGSGFNMGPEGGICKFIHMPWEFGGCAIHKIVAKNGKWVDSLGYELDDLIIKKEEFPYKYTLRDGTVQERVATVTCSRMVWHWRIFRKLGLHIGPKRDSTSIWVSFNGEIGEQTGSWKGGTTGCGYEMLKGETPEQTLRRMEIERKFN